MILLKNLCDYDYDYDYSKMCNWLQSITIIIVIRPNPGTCMRIIEFIKLLPWKGKSTVQFASLALIASSARY